MDDLSTNPLTIAFPSKGRLKEQAEAWLAECGFKLEAVGGARGYRAAIAGLPGAQVQLLSASDIAQAVDDGEVHLGLTGEDLLRERGEDLDNRVMLLRALGFGRADLIVAAPRAGSMSTSWLILMRSRRPIWPARVGVCGWRPNI